MPLHVQATPQPGDNGPERGEEFFQKVRDKELGRWPSPGMKDSNKTEPYIRRAALPEVMFAADIALALDVPDWQAEDAARAGLCGPYFTVDGRPAVLRQDFLDTLTLRAATDRKEVFPHPRPTPVQEVNDGR